MQGCLRGDSFYCLKKFKKLTLRMTPPLASLGGVKEKKKRVIGRHPVLSLGALRPELDREHLGRYIDEWIGTRPRLVPFY